MPVNNRVPLPLSEIGGDFRTRESVGDGLAHLLIWLDNGAVTAKNLLKAGYKFFRFRVLGMKRKFIKKENSNDVTATREIFTDIGNGKILKKTEEEVIFYEDLPDEVRREMIRQQTNEAELDEKEFVLAKAKDNG